MGPVARLLRVPDIGHYPPFENPEWAAQVADDSVRTVTVMAG